MKIYNTYTRTKEDFKPLEAETVKMYVCGPTVYDYIHIGNARPVIFFDVVRRYFESQGLTVDYVSNITDVDDKIINKAITEGVSELEISEKYLAQYLDDCAALNILPVKCMPKVTESMDEIIAFIDQLVRDGFAYAVAGDVYFRVKKAADYGKLSGKKIDDLVVGARVEENTKKEDPLDFTLWKKTDVGITWVSPWGNGRPGWHTECVVMIEDAFNGKIDIHGGGSDLQFPHHENEIAQSVCASNHTIANTWMHVGRLGLDGEKMSKSVGNVVLVKELLKQYAANAFRLFMLSTHYRQPLNFSYDVLDQASKEWEKVETAYRGLYRYLDLFDDLDIDTSISPATKTLSQEFNDAMNDDFNTANAITALYMMAKEANIAVRAKADVTDVRQLLNNFNYFLNMLGLTVVPKRFTKEEKEIYLAWEQARKDQDFAKADELRGQLQERELI